ncbi:MAG: S-layer homology domain-containing protein [Syntrophomonadaceae bacterium]|nr:S-layer homology domain-containing protein [Syntrophomonadaceae bacterium]
MLSQQRLTFPVRLCLSLAAALIMLLATGLALSVEAAAVPADMQNHWAAKQVAEWIEAGLVGGFPDGTFRPDQSITRAQFITMVNAVLGLQEKAPISYADVKADDWFAPEIAKAKKSGYISGYPDNTIRPNNTITRQEIAVILAGILELDPSPAGINRFKDAGTVAPWSRDAMGAVTAAGILSGFPDGTCRPTDVATRAQAVVILSKAAGAMYTEAGLYTLQVVDGNATINTGGVTLKGGTIKGSLLLTEGIGEGSIVLEDVTVNGRTVVCGGGSESITFKNCNLGVIVIRKSSGPVRIVATGNTNIQKVIVKTEARLENRNNTGRGFNFNNTEIRQGAKATIDGKGPDESKPQPTTSGGGGGGSSSPSDSKISFIKTVLADPVTGGTLVTVFITNSSDADRVSKVTVKDQPAIKVAGSANIWRIHFDGDVAVSDADIKITT